MKNQPDELAREDDMPSSPHRRLNTLRGLGYTEMFFSPNDPKHIKEYSDLCAELRFYNLNHESVTVDGAVILFMHEEVAEFIGIKARRTAMDQTFVKDEEAKDKSETV